MPVNSALVGGVLPTLTIAVTPRMALAYAAGIGAVDALDDARADFAALPFFCVSLEWQLVIAARNRMLGVSSDEAIRAVHVGQQTRFFAPLRPEQDVRVSGRILEVRRTRAGALTISELNVTAEGGTEISSTRSAGLYRDVEVAGEDRSIADMPLAAPSVPPSDIRETSIALDRGFAHRYSEAANIWNPIHTERRVALAAGLPDIIVHGTALWAIAGKVLVDRFAPGAPQRLASLSRRFAAMVLAGTSIVVRHGVDAHSGAVSFTVLNDRGQQAIASGSAAFN
jgi:acyl dehydratase